jgi:hypothetical protein
MNLLADHERLFRRNQRFAIVLYAMVCVWCIGWGFSQQHILDNKILLLHSQGQALKTRLHLKPTQTTTEDRYTMENAKNHLTHLFSVPLPGISFSVLSLDETGMHVRGSARTPESLEKWLSHISEIFAVDTRTSRSKSGRELMFEVSLHEKS